jgi:WD40 repeat protein
MKAMHLMRISRRTVLGSALGALSGVPARAAGPAPWCVAFSPDGRTVASGWDDGAVRRWRMPGGDPLPALRGHTDAVFGVACARDGRIVSCGRDTPQVRVWDAAAAKTVLTLDPHDRWTWSARPSPDGKRLATCGGDAMVRVWDLETGARLAELRGHQGAVKRLAWTPDGKRVVSVGDDTLVHVWDAGTGADLHAMAGHTSWLEGVACGPHGLAVTVSGDGTVRAWDLDQARPLRTFAGTVRDLACVALSADGEWAATGAADGALRLWRVSTGAETARWEFPSGVLDVQFSPDGRNLVAAYREGTVRAGPCFAPGAPAGTPSQGTSGFAALRPEQPAK